MKCEIFAGRDLGILEALINGFLTNKKAVEIKQSVVRGTFFYPYPYIIITIFYEELPK